MDGTASPPLAVALVLSLAAGCGDNQDPIGADQLWTRIHDEHYTSWSRAPGYETRRPAQSPHSDEVIIYLAPTIAAAVAGHDPLTAWPIGSLIVKEGYSGDELDLVAVMEKRDTGWYWAEYDGHGSASYSGKPAVCTGCHAVGADYVRAFALPASP